MNEYEPLIEDYLNGDLAEADASRLHDWLLQDERHMQLFVRMSHQHGVLRDVLSGAGELDQLAEHRPARPVSPCDAKNKSALMKAYCFFAQPTPFSMTVAALVMIAIVSAMAFMVPPFYRTLTRNGEAPPSGRYDIVAEVTGKHEVEWADPNDSLHRGAFLVPGREIHLHDGIIEITYQDGAVVALEGPCEYVVEDLGRGKLTRGRLLANVPESAVGFRVATQNVEITDLGTEFGVEVQTSGAAEIVVLLGEVELARKTGSATSDRKVRLTKDQSASVAAGSGVITRRTKNDGELTAAMRSRFVKMRQRAAIAQPSTIIVNAGFERASGIASNGNLATPAYWNEENADQVFVDNNGLSWTPESDRALYLNAANAAVNQDLRHTWSSTDSYTLSIVGFEPQFTATNSGDAFSIQLREVDGTVLWESGPQSVDGTVSGSQGGVSYTAAKHRFQWAIDASTFASVSGAAEGSRLNIRIVSEGGSPYLDDVSISVTVPEDPEPSPKP